MKKKILIITSVILIIGLLCSTLVGCKSAAEKEAAYYEKVAASLEKTTGTLTTLTDELFSKSWTASFVLAITSYKQEVKDDNGEIVELKDSPITRGSATEAGWPSGVGQYVTAIAFDVTYNSADDYSFKTTVFEDVTRSNYLSYISKKDYRSKFTVSAEFEYSLKDGVESGSYYIDPIEFIKDNTNTQTLTRNGISASDNFRIYTHFMRVESRTVFDKDLGGRKN
ncbi:MAG: hypothetical protein K2G37_02385 [Clostridia bacterium]|nr:hypothetical protein [Clostridia bacterium]